MDIDTTEQCLHNWRFVDSGTNWERAADENGWTIQRNMLKPKNVSHDTFW